ncbi:helix-turn-helix domain-containing protein [Bacillus paralicheniformis]|uniref:LexA family protein n=1 Tax=Bacillus TaxID=1386 RepID=UPI000F07593F|nr:MULTISPECIES: XRE family transcriptional regulator [Bacillus]AYQ15180.1 XRE family transcriptional regulator [Bacillus paralicheniformis]MCI4128193.1 helix-turn-helix domain-containing protein [Bacillus haynesii]MCV9370841.1 helix-turn-helix domain-containing protein [Bacillus paralicheniformis]MEC1037601.1 XRE family transcriptional regulator [Bacillus licheniformis]WOH91943.1 XRE family transcriptional regulator [Bacillus paralicheniformis]
MIDIQKLKEIMANNLKKQLKRKGISQTMMARDLNIPEMTVSNWVKGKTYPRPDKIQLMADYFGITRTQLTEESPSNLTPIAPQTVPIPVLGTIACGEPILAEENVTEYVYESPDQLPSGNLFYLKAKGTSMEPTIPDGSYVLVREQPEVENGEIAAVLVNGDTEATLKRIKRQGDIVILMPDNPNYSPFIITPENPARIIGQAIQFTQKL